MAWTHEVLFLAIFLILFIVVSIPNVQSKEMLIVEHLCGSSSPLFNLFLVFGKNLLNHCWSQQSTLNRTGKERAEEERKRDEVCVCVCVALSVFVLTACWQWQIENPSGLILSFSAPSNRKVVGVCVSVCVCVCVCVCVWKRGADQSWPFNSFPRSSIPSPSSLFYFSESPSLSPFLLPPLFHSFQPNESVREMEETYTP